jgi:branched-chain amino acid transport system permease protein
VGGVSTTAILQGAATGVAVGAIYALIALGYSIIFSTTRVVNFAQGDLLAIGALVAYTLHVSHSWPIPLTFLGVAAVMCVAGVVFEKLIMIPTRLSGSHFAWIIVTLALSLALENLLVIPYGRSLYTFPPLLEGRPLHLGGVVVQRQQIIVIAAAIVLMVAFELFLTRTRQGRAIRAAAFSPDVTELMGIDVGRIVTLTFVISAVITGIAGLLVAPLQLSSTSMGQVLGIKGFIAIVLGGMGSAKGAAVGGIVLGVAEGVFSVVMPTGWQNVAVYGALALILLVRPSGLFGQRIEA